MVQANRPGPVLNWVCRRASDSGVTRSRQLSIQGRTLKDACRYSTSALALANMGYSKSWGMSQGLGLAINCAPGPFLHSAAG